MILLLTLLVSFAFQAQEVSQAESPVEQVRGVVLAADNSPLEGVLVEIYTNPEQAIRRLEGSHTQKQIAQSKSDKQGRFQFKAIPPGDYELRFTKREFNITAVIVTVATKKKAKITSKKPLTIVLVPAI